MDRSFKVICALSPDAPPKEIDMSFIELPGRAPFPLPCAGCADANDSPACTLCRDSITTMLWKDPDRVFVEPFLPADSARG